MRDFFTALLENVYTRFGLVYANAREVASGAMWIAHDAEEDRNKKPGLPVEWCRTCNTPRSPPTQSKGGHNRGSTPRGRA